MVPCMVQCMVRGGQFNVRARLMLGSAEDQGSSYCRWAMEEDPVSING